MGHTYAEKLFLIDLKFNFTQVSYTLKQSLC
jgi:hypothetical protein